jgi:hypothetical protein
MVVSKGRFREKQGWFVQVKNLRVRPLRNATHFRSSPPFNKLFKVLLF